MKFSKPVIAALLLLFAALIFVTSCSSVDEPPVIYLENIEVTYIAPSQAPAIDGVLEPIWQAANVTQLISDQGSDYNPSNKLGLVNISAMSDSTYVYISASWKDETRNVRFLQLIWNNQFGWNRPALGREDNISFFFTEADGSTDTDPNCFAMCHTAELIMVNETGTPVDGWHWRASLTNPISRAADLWFEDSLDADTLFNGLDAESSPGYEYNSTMSGLFVPKYWNSTVTVDTIVVGEDTTLLFDNGEYLIDTDTVSYTSFPEGVDLDSVLVPSFVVFSNPSGSRWDVQAKGIWDEVSRRWTVEFKRLMNTGNADDIQFGFGDQIRIVVAVSNNAKHPHTGYDPVILEF